MAAGAASQDNLHSKLLQHPELPSKAPDCMVQNQTKHEDKSTQHTLTSGGSVL